MSEYWRMQDWRDLLDWQESIWWCRSCFKTTEEWVFFNEWYNQISRIG